MSPESGEQVFMKDVYDLVNSTRREINDSIGALGSKFDSFVTSNEHRLTLLETHQAAQALQMTEVVARIDEHGRDIGLVKDQLQKDEAAARAVSNVKKGRSTVREKVLTLVLTAVIALGAILALIFH